MTLPTTLTVLFTELDARFSVAEHARPYLDAFVEQREHIVGCGLPCAHDTVWSTGRQDY